MLSGPATYDARRKLRLFIVLMVCTVILLIYFFLFYYIDDRLFRSMPFQVALVLFVLMVAVSILYVLFYYIEKCNSTHEPADPLGKVKKIEALGLVAGGVAHDLNNILSGIVSIPQMLLLDLPENSPLRAPVAMIMDSGKRAGKIVDELLTIGRGITLADEPAHLNHIIHNALSSGEFQLLKKFHSHVTFRCELYPDLPCINGSDVHLQKAVLNLIANAAEATESPGEVLIETGIVTFKGKPLPGYTDVKDGTYVQLNVTDTGEGIPGDALDHLFEPFYTKKKLGRSGTGLGLFIVRHTVHDHKGYVVVDATAGRTTFQLYFPVSGELKQTPAVSDRSMENYLGHGEHILVVDDIQIQRQVATIMLNRIGYRVSAFSSGEEAIEFVKEQKVDLAILDMIMEPKMNGLDTFRALRQIDPDIKFLITSGYSMTSDVKKALARGIGAFIKKPYSIEQIGLAIKKELAPGDLKGKPGVCHVQEI